MSYSIKLIDKSTKETMFAKYTGLKDFSRGIQKLCKAYGNIPVFIRVSDDKVAPFGLAIRMSSLMDCNALVLTGGVSGKPETFKTCDCTD